MKDCIRIERPEQCCGCGACQNACAVRAITMKEDAAGFIYPAVDESLCVSCGRCKAVCVFEKAGVGANERCTVYAASSRDRDVLMQSSSGGIFTELARAVLKKGGAVFGAAWTGEMTVQHILAESEADLAKLRGSKYVQSQTGDCFAQVKKLLQDGRYVLYSGTPCQIAGLKAFLGKDDEHLITADIICHGVPSMKMLRDDLTHVSNQPLGALQNVRFRDKRFGWGVKGSYTVGGKTVKYSADNSPYYFYFLKGEVYRESCYRCRFPSEGRQGDLTLGDYWGVRHELIAQMGAPDPDKGISCILVNSEKGDAWLKEIAPALAIAQSDRKSAEKRNHQLKTHSEKLPEHETLLRGYIENGYAALRCGYKKHAKDHIVRTVKNLIPAKIKRKLNDLRG